MLGYACQGNEWSFFMLFSSNFVLNGCSEINKYKLYPWIHQFSNNRRSADQIQPIFFPDVDPHGLPPGSNFSMTAGDFQEIYSECSKLKVLSKGSSEQSIVSRRLKILVEREGGKGRPEDRRRPLVNLVLGGRNTSWGRGVQSDWACRIELLGGACKSRN